MSSLPVITILILIFMMSFYIDRTLTLHIEAIYYKSAKIFFPGYCFCHITPLDKKLSLAGAHILVIYSLIHSTNTYCLLCIVDAQFTGTHGDW